MKIVHISEKEEANKEIFWEILSDETIAEDTFLIPKVPMQKAGGWNARLKAKRLYELLLRLLDLYSIRLEECDATISHLEEYITIEKEEKASAWESLCTDCYIIARYKEKLLEWGYFDCVVESVLEYADTCGLQEQAVAQLEKMLNRSEAYYEIDDATRPILIYKGEDICHNILNVFAEQFGEALERYGCPVEYFDSQKDDLNTVTKYVGEHYRAIIGVQSYMFSIKMADGMAYLHNLIYGPKFNFIFDHPVWLKNHLEGNVENFCVLTHDNHYVKFIEDYYRQKAVLFPPAGIVSTKMQEEKVYDISFVGTFGNYWNEILLIRKMERKQRFMANRFLLFMRKNPDMTSEDAFHQVLKFYGRDCYGEEFLELFYPMRRVIYCVMHYYRYQVIKTLLEDGLRVDVFGDSWEGCPLRRYSNLVCHAGVTSQESLKVYRQSKLSLNVMSWHKGGFTERMANIMLAGAVLVTDWTDYLQGRFETGKDLIIFRLEERKHLPKRIRKLLVKEEQWKYVMENGKKKAEAFHTWDSRAKEFIEDILEGDICRKK